MTEEFREVVRDGGYEALFWAAGLLGQALHPTQRNAERMESWVHEAVGRRQSMRRLRARGLMEERPGHAAGALRLTELGSLTLAGGRDPAGRWRRAWDGQWRLLAFDIPAKTQAPRMKFWRWLRANHFGLLQKSVWIHPDPIPDVDGFAEAAGLPLSHMVLFSGELSGGMRPRAIADAAWKFDEIDAGYRAYLAFAERAGRQLRTKAPSEKLLREIVVEDRHAWQAAVRPDPLLPKALLPPDYEGRAAWKARQKLHHALWKLRPAP